MLVCNENFCRLKKSAGHFAVKPVLSYAKSCEEHNETKYSPHRTNDGGVMDLFVSGCWQNHGKRMKIEMDKAFWTIVKKATFLACFIN